MFGALSSDIVSWRLADFYKDVIAVDYKVKTDEFEISNVHISTAIPRLTCFVSLVHRVLLHVKFKDRSSQRQISYIVKERVDTNDEFEVAGHSCVFSKEIELYTQILPSIEKQWANESVKFGPR